MYTDDYNDLFVEMILEIDELDSQKAPEDKNNFIDWLNNNDI